MKPNLVQKCPFSPCTAEIRFEVVGVEDGGRNDRGGVSLHVKAQTTPESTAHVYSHIPKEVLA